MTEADAIQAVEKFARRRRYQLGEFESAWRIKEHPTMADSPSYEAYLRNVGNWRVDFRIERPGVIMLQRDQFLVDDSTGRVAWLNGPPPFWFQALAVMALPLYWTMSVAWSFQDAWYQFRLPRCPKCHVKLRTHRSQRCRHCKFDWH